MAPYQLTASIVCGNMLDIQGDFEQLQRGEIDGVHFDVMDGRFVPRYGLHPEMLQAIHRVTSLPVDVHMMVEDAEPFVQTFAASGADTITVHAEAQRHLHRTVQMIRSQGVRAGVALNPATSLTVLDYLWGDIDLVLLMGINPGIVGHQLIAGTYKKIEELRGRILHAPHPIRIEIDGGVTSESAPRMVAAGADVLVCGNSTIFKNGRPVSEWIRSLRHTIDQSQSNVAVLRTHRMSTAT